MDNFMEVINGWVTETEDKIDAVLQTIVLKVGESLVHLSPVDTGRFKGNWQLSIDSTSSSSLFREDPEGYATLSEISRTSKTLTAGQVAYIQNHVLYGYDIEYGTYNGPTAKVTSAGYSRQAPDGVLRITEARFTRIVNEAILLNT